jgi:flagellar hook-associated protein 2
VNLATGDDMDGIVSKFNTMFTSAGMKLTASNVGGQLVITGATYGSTGKFNVSFSGNNPTTQLGLTAGQVTGTDIAGTIGGAAATGSGQRLTSTAGTAQGLSIKYTGSAAFSGQIVHTLGAAALLTNLADAITRSGDGLAELQKTSLQTQIDDLTTQSTTVQERLDRHRAALVAQFTKMETALSLLNAQGAALTNQIKSLQSSSN